MTDRRRAGRHALLVALILLLGIGLRFREIADKSLWHDEAHSLAFVRLPRGEMGRALAFDDHPPLYYLLLREWMRFGEGATWGRVLSATLSSATLPAAYALGRMVAGPTAGLMALLFLAVSPQAVHYGQELRMYALQSFLLAWMMALGLSGIRRGGRGAAAGALGLGVLACYTHYFSGIFVIGFLIALGASWRARGIRWGRIAVGVSAGALACAVLYLPWLPTGMSHLMINAFRGLKAASPAAAPGAEFLARGIETTVGFTPMFPFDRTLFAAHGLSAIRRASASGATLLLLGLFLLGLLATRQDAATRRFCLGFIVAPWVLAILYEMAGGRFYARFLLPLLPMGFAFAAAGLLRLPGVVFPWLPGAALAAILLASAMETTRVDLRDASLDAARQLREARERLKGRPGETAPVLHAAPHSFWTLMGYDPTPDRHRFLAGPDVPALARLMYGPTFQTTRQDLAGMSSVWVAYSEWSAGPPQLRRRIEPLWFGHGWRIVEGPFLAQRYIKKIEVALYERF